MYEIAVACKGVSEGAARAALDDIVEEFSQRPWHTVVDCRWDEDRILLVARNDYDENGKALLDEFSDAICACVPIEDSTISFAVESVTEVSGGGV